MAVLKCKMCGGELSFEEGATVCECEYCGSKQTIPNVDDEKRVKLYERANRLRLNNEFDKAYGVYESIIAESSEEAEAYWGLVLCKYGIEYVDDPATGDKVPTCHRSSFDSVMDDENFEMVMENADSAARGVYREQAKAIEEIRKGIIEVSSKEEPYDIFICYKETDENGDRTVDSLIAQDTYDALTEKGYKVFFSRITLEDKLGQEYEPYIFAALNSAKVMLVFGTDYEYFNAVWVKNEWSRFLQLMARGEKKTLIPCYKNLDAYDIPKEFAKLQAQDMGKVGAIQDLLRGIEKIISLKREPEVKIKMVQPAGNPTVTSLLERVELFLEDKKWDTAKEYCERVLDTEPKNAKAYLYKTCAELRMSNPSELQYVKYDIENNSNLIKALRFADEMLSAEINSIIDNAKEYRKQQDEIRKAEEERQRKEEEKRQRKEAQEEEERQQHALKQRKNEALKRCRVMNIDNMVSAKDYPISIACGHIHTVGLKSDGTLMAVGDNSFGQCDVNEWNDIISIACGGNITVGLKSDGTVIVIGDRNSGTYDVKSWQNVISVACDGVRILGLTSDGEVIKSINSQFSQVAEIGHTNVETWSDITSLACSGHVIGLKNDGTVVASGSNFNGECNVETWSDITSIDCGFDFTVGLKSDGTVIATGWNKHGQCNVSQWTDIFSISCGERHVVGLKKDGTVVATGSNVYNQCDVGSWHDIVSIACGSYHTVGLKKDGTTIAVGWNEFGQTDNAIGLNLLSDNDLSAEQMEKIRKEKEHVQQMRDKLRADRRAWGVCQHCGGSFKGLFSKTCTNWECGRPKDY